MQSLRIAAERDRAAEERVLADRERRAAEEVSSFLVNLFKLSDPQENRGNQVTRPRTPGLGCEALCKRACKINRRRRRRCWNGPERYYDSLGSIKKRCPY